MLDVCRTVFAIHIGRMRIDPNLVGMIGPLFAVLGDLGTALLIAFGLVLPVRLAWRALTRPLERSGWIRVFAQIDQGHKPGLTGKLFKVWLVSQLRFARRFSQLRHSPLEALRWGMLAGLPATAILIAVNPIWGFSWFFNSESWATGVWNHWAEARTDIWRENMIEAIRVKSSDKQVDRDGLFLVEPAGVKAATISPFWCLAIRAKGDPLNIPARSVPVHGPAGRQVSGDLVGCDLSSRAMMDYESSSTCPSRGSRSRSCHSRQPRLVRRPGRVLANFLNRTPRGPCMLSREDRRSLPRRPKAVSTGTSRKRAVCVKFSVSTGWQRGPFFEIRRTASLIAVDTGVLRVWITVSGIG